MMLPNLEAEIYGNHDIMPDCCLTNRRTMYVHGEGTHFDAEGTRVEAYDVVHHAVRRDAYRAACTAITELRKLDGESKAVDVLAHLIMYVYSHDPETLTVITDRIYVNMRQIPGEIDPEDLTWQGGRYVGDE
jgi:hypothetical protein